MKAHLLFRDRDLDISADDPHHTVDLIADLELDTLLDAMATEDQLIRTVSRTVLLHGLLDSDEIEYRHRALHDCLRQADAVQALYQLTGEAIIGERRVFGAYISQRPESLLYRSVQVLELFVGFLKTLRQIGAEVAPQFESEAFRTFFAMLEAELADDYLDDIGLHLKQLRFKDGLLVSARLGRGNGGIDFVLRRPKDENRSFFNRAGLKKPTFSYTIPDRDMGALNALSDLRDRGLREIANAAAQAVDHVLSFFHAMRRELAFYLGCLNLCDKLHRVGAPVSFPTVQPLDSRAFAAAGLYDAALCLRMQARIVGNTVDADGRRLIMITGANQGGKSTFLRSVGLAQLMTSAGMFVCADQVSAAISTGVFTHFKREEDGTMESGKLDEELARMSELANQLTGGALLLCNESFQSTNEREGSEIGRQVLRAMVDAGVRVFFVTHMFDLAHGFYTEAATGTSTLFLRAVRNEDGGRTFRVVPGEPLPTSYGQDIYDRIFGAARSA